MDQDFWSGHKGPTTTWHAARDAFGHLDPNKAESVIKKLRKEALKEIGGADTGEKNTGDKETEE